jgi:hypothetical protein
MWLAVRRLKRHIAEFAAKANEYIIPLPLRQWLAGLRTTNAFSFVERPFKQPIAQFSHHQK